MLFSRFGSDARTRMIATRGCCAYSVFRFFCTIRCHKYLPSSVLEMSDHRKKFFTITSVCCALFAGMCAVLACGGYRNVPTAANLSVDEFTRDLGEMRWSESKETSFTLLNKSSSVISVESVHVGCTCTDWSLSKDKLNPNDSAELAVKFNSRQARGDVRTGVRVYYKTLQNNDYGHLYLLLTASVNPDYEFDPEEVVFTMDGTAKQKVALRSMVGEKVRIVDAKSSRDWLSVHVLSGRDGRDDAMEIAFVPDEWPHGDCFAEVNIETDNPRQARFRLPVRIISEMP